MKTQGETGKRTERSIMIKGPGKNVGLSGLEQITLYNQGHIRGRNRKRPGGKRIWCLVRERMLGEDLGDRQQLVASVGERRDN